MITTGSITRIMNVKKYSRSLNCHKLLYEAIFRLLFNKFVEEHELSNNLKLLSEEFLNNINKEGCSFF